MGMKSGMRAAQRQGVATAPVKIGPRGGKFYINAQGHKVYGEPPHGGGSHGPTTMKAEARAPKKPKVVPPHLKVGATVHVEVEGEGIIKGKVISVGKANVIVRPSVS